MCKRARASRCSDIRDCGSDTDVTRSQISFSNARTVSVKLPGKVVNKLVVDPSTTIVHQSIDGKNCFDALPSLNEGHMHDVTFLETRLESQHDPSAVDRVLTLCNN